MNHKITCIQRMNVIYFAFFMSNSEWVELIGFAEDMLYLLVAFMCGLIIGYISGRME